MAEFVADCPRCGAERITFDLKESNWAGERYGWQQFFEAFCVCRHCHKSTTFNLAQRTSNNAREVARLSIENGVQALAGAVNDYFEDRGYISMKDMAAEEPPEHLPPDIEAAFREGATCMSVGCYNAAGAMFRLCLDFATKSMMPADDVDGLNSKIRRSLGLRLNWLFETQKLPQSLQELSSCVKEDGNDGAHDGSLTQVDAEDIQDFTFVLLERLYTEPARVDKATARREARRKSK